MQKRGQFYLLSAIVIIAIIIGFSAISTYTKKTENIRIFDLGEELQIESANVLDYGTYPANKADITTAGGLDDFITDFVEDYAEYLGEDKDVSFIFGNPEESTAKVVNYGEVSAGTIKDLASATITLRGSSEETTKITTKEGKRTTKIIFNDQEYEIELKPGENFFFVISQEVGSEVHIAKSPEIEGAATDINVCESDSDCTDGRVCLGGTCRTISPDDESSKKEEDKTPVCGDRTLDSGESCDDGTDNGVVCTAEYGSSCTYCDTSCNIQTVYGGTCGDGNVASGEACDNGANNDVECTPTYGSSCDYCDASCNIQTKSGGYCGDDIKQNDYEECDDGSDNRKRCNPGGVGGSCDYCSNSCKTGECWKFLFWSGCD